MGLLRTDKILAASGLVSRSGARALVKSGRVTADGEPVRSPDEKYDPDRTVIAVSGEPVCCKEHYYLMMNKPAGYVSATRDNRERCVTELISGPAAARGLFPAGRLDKDAEGLLILTDDGAFAHTVTSPKKKVFKKYLVLTDTAFSDSDKEAFEEGILLGSGEKCLPAKLEILSDNRSNIYISEGKYHQIKRMSASRGKKVEHLKRLAIGGLSLDVSLEPGQWRELREEEKLLLQQF